MPGVIDVEFDISPSQIYYSTTKTADFIEIRRFLLPIEDSKKS